MKRCAARWLRGVKGRNLRCSSVNLYTNKIGFRREYSNYEVDSPDLWIDRLSPDELRAELRHYIKENLKKDQMMRKMGASSTGTGGQPLPISEFEGVPEDAGKSIGSCPKCKNGEVISRRKIWGCNKYNPNNPSDSCDFAIPRVICKKPLTEHDAVNVIERGETERLNNFVSKKNKYFNAVLELDESCKLVFRFDDIRSNRGGNQYSQRNQEQEQEQEEEGEEEGEKQGEKESDNKGYRY